MLYIAHSGAYLIDRKLKVARAQMRFPLWTRDGVRTETPADMAAWLKLFDAGKMPRPTRVSASQMQFHHGTLLDGEMCVNTQADGTQERVFYVYDLMMLHGVNVTARPWKVCA